MPSTTSAPPCAIARGVIYSDDFKMRGPAAKVNMSGLADLNREAVQLRVKVIPKLIRRRGRGGALLGRQPLAGVGALVRAQTGCAIRSNEATSRIHGRPGMAVHPM